MSADNRIIIAYNSKSGRYHLWEGSMSMNYFDVTGGSLEFLHEEDAFKKACEMSKDSYYEGGIQTLTKDEIILGLREELDMVKNPSYCSECGACGEDGCCSGAMCKHNKCLHGEHYSRDYSYNKDMANELFKELKNRDEKKLDEIFNTVYDRHYKKI